MRTLALLLFSLILAHTAVSQQADDNPYRNVDPLGGTPVQSTTIDGSCRNTKSNRHLVEQRGDTCYWYIKSPKRISGQVVPAAQVQAIETSGGSCHPNPFDPENTSICMQSGSNHSQPAAANAQSGSGSGIGAVAGFLHRMNSDLAPLNSGAPPRGGIAPIQSSLPAVREVVLTAWLDPSPANLARLPNQSQIQASMRQGAQGQCVASYVSAADSIRRGQQDLVARQMKQGDLCAQRLGIQVGDGSPVASTNEAGEHLNANGCVVRGDSTRCPSVGEMNNAASLKLSPDEVAKRMNLSSLSVDELWQRGSDFYAHRQYLQAAGDFFRGANLHDARAQAALGNMYDQGLGIDHDPIRAMFWIGEAARAGNRGAEYMYGVYWEDGEQLPADMRRAFPWYLASAQQGFGRAQMRVGLGYYFGDGVAQNKPLGLQWLRKAQASDYGPAGVFADILVNPSTPRNMTFAQFSQYVARLQEVQNEKVLRIMMSGLGHTSHDQQGWQSKADALEAQHEYSRASTCRSIGTYC
jgi:TPR repeat protein